jgi:UDP-N-acetylmuramoyl-tripeptide--D-alanyl-D-alanine ligase
MRMRLSELAAATGASVVGGPDVAGDELDVEVVGASIDSRTMVPGQLFVAVRAERDGHDFVSGAVDRGAAAVIVDHVVDLDASVAQLVVTDTVDALSRAGAAARAALDGPVIAITGSVGKTSTKDLLAAVCREAGVTSASEKSLNNELGVPLTLLNSLDGTQRTVVEMGARGQGHIRDLCSIASPTVGLVTTVAAAHTELFGTVDDVARAKSELVAALPASGTAVLNADVGLVAAMASLTDAEVVFFGEGGDVFATDIELDDELRASFVLSSPWGTVDVRLGVTGRHNVTNALAAAAAALVSGVSLDQVATGLGRAELSPWRMQLLRSPAGARVLNDAYNASPMSMTAALTALSQIDAERRIAVLGPMAELGERSALEHRNVRDVAESLGIEVIAVATAAYGDGVEVVELSQVVERLGPLTTGDAVLLKGSRVAGLEVLADALVSGRRWPEPASE